MLPKRLLFATPLLMFASAARAAPRISRIRFHLPTNETPLTTFQPSAPAIHLLAELAEMTPGMKVKVVWIASNTDGAPPDTQIIDQLFDIADRRIDTLRSRLTLNGNPWPLGDYRADLFINDAPAGSGTFRVAA